jgi:hypothetical protein
MQIACREYREYREYKEYKEYRKYRECRECREYKELLLIMVIKCNFYFSYALFIHASTKTYYLPYGTTF